MLDQDRYHVLFYRPEVDNATVERTVAEFLGLTAFTLIRVNVGSEKDQSAMHQRFVREIGLPKEYADAICDSKYTRRFYGWAVIKAIRAKWLERSNE